MNGCAGGRGHGACHGGAVSSPRSSDKRGRVGWPTARHHRAPGSGLCGHNQRAGEEEERPRETQTSARAPTARTKLLTIDLVSEGGGRKPGCGGGGALWGCCG